MENVNYHDFFKKKIGIISPAKWEFSFIIIVPNKATPSNLRYGFHQNFVAEVDWRGRCETPAGKTRLGETPQAQAEEAPGPPAESECLERKSTSKGTTHKKTEDKLDFHRVCLQSEPFN